MKGFLKDLKGDHNYLLDKYGLKVYSILLFKLFFYIFVNPIIMILLYFFINKILAYIYLIVVLYGFIIVFGGKKIVKALKKWQFKRYMRKLEKEK